MQSSIDGNGTFEFTCQHGPRECEGNIVEGCANLLAKDVDQSLSFVNCVSEKDPRDKPFEFEQVRHFSKF